MQTTEIVVHWTKSWFQMVSAIEGFYSRRVLSHCIVDKADKLMTIFTHYSYAQI